MNATKMRPVGHQGRATSSNPRFIALIVMLRLIR
jgi:hypothetical protein